MFDWLKRRIIEERGYTLGFTLGVVSILVILGAGLLWMVSHEMTMIAKHADSTRAYYLAEAGINHALWNLDNSRSGAIGSETTQTALGAGSYYTTYDSNTSLLTSVGTVSSVSRRIRVRTKQEELPLSLQRAVTAARSNEIHGDQYPDSEDNIFICNDTTDTERVLICGSEATWNIHGWLFNLQETTTSSNYLGWAYNVNGVVPENYQYDPPPPPENKYPDAHWKEATTYTASEPPNFETTSYEEEIRTASTTGTTATTLETVTLQGGEKRYYKGNLTIDGAAITCDSTTTAAVIVAYGNITIRDSIIGDAAGGKIKIIAGGGDDDNPGTNVDALIIEGDNDSNYTYLGKDIELYSNAQTRVNDHVYRLAEGCSSVLLSRYTLYLESDYSSGPAGTNYNIDLEGVVFSREGIHFDTEGGRRVRIRGSIIAGDLQNPDGRLHFGNIKKQLWLIYDRGAIPEAGVKSAFDAISGVTLDYTTWRED